MKTQNRISEVENTAKQTKKCLHKTNISLLFSENESALENKRNKTSTHNCPIKQSPLCHFPLNQFRERDKERTRITVLSGNG